jgi:hypothetical protein
MGGCKGCRWFAVRLSKNDETDEYGVEMWGMTIVQNESNRYRTEQTTSPHAVIDFLAMGDPAARYVPKISRKALHEAGDLDQGLADALDDFDSVVSR